MRSILFCSVVRLDIDLLIFQVKRRPDFEATTGLSLVEKVTYYMNHCNSMCNKIFHTKIHSSKRLNSKPNLVQFELC